MRPYGFEAVFGILMLCRSGFLKPKHTVDQRKTSALGSPDEIRRPVEINRLTGKQIKTVGKQLGDAALPEGVNAFLTSFKKLKDYLWLVSLLSGIFLIIVGVMIFTNSLRLLAAWLARYGIGWSVGQ